MRILIITQIYVPEMGALSNRLYPIVRELVRAGHEVFVATGMPNYPSGKVFPDYKGKLFSRTRDKGYTIIRTAYFTVPRNKSRWSQLLSYLSFVPAVLISGLRAGKVDVVFVTSPPTFPILAAILLARLRRARLVSDVRDLWSDELITYDGKKPDSLPIRVARAIERWGYRSSDLTGCTTRSLLNTVIERGSDPEKTFLFPNGADLELFHPRPRDNEIGNSFGAGDRFVVLYSGLLGIKHGLEVLLDAAKILRDRRDIVFLLIGDGARRQAIAQYAQDNGLDNVIIGGERRVEEIPWIIARSDVCFAACQEAPYIKSVISVKVFEYLACERPVVGSCDGETAAVLHASSGGIVVPPGDARQTADAILELYGNAERRLEIGKAGRRFVEANYSRSNWAKKFEQMLSQTCTDPGRLPAVEAEETR